jgi:hypothetical protein
MPNASDMKINVSLNTDAARETLEAFANEAKRIQDEHIEKVRKAAVSSFAKVATEQFVEDAIRALHDKLDTRISHIETGEPTDASCGVCLHVATIHSPYFGCAVQKCGCKGFEPMRKLDGGPTSCSRNAGAESGENPGKVSDEPRQEGDSPVFITRTRYRQLLNAEREREIAVSELLTLRATIRRLGETT